jgi:hypothetical protein
MTQEKTSENVREITVEEWRAGYFTVRPNRWGWLVKEKQLQKVVEHRDWERVENWDVDYTVMPAGTVVVKEPQEEILEMKK